MSTVIESSPHASSRSAHNRSVAEGVADHYHEIFVSFLSQRNCGEHTERRTWSWTLEGDLRTILPIRHCTSIGLSPDAISTLCAHMVRRHIMDTLPTLMYNAAHRTRNKTPCKNLPWIYASVRRDVALRKVFPLAGHAESVRAACSKQWQSSRIYWLEKSRF